MANTPFPTIISPPLSTSPTTPALSSQIVSVLKSSPTPLKPKDLFAIPSISSLTPPNPNPKNRIRAIKRICNKLVSSKILIDTTGRTDAQGSGPYAVAQGYTGTIPTYTPKTRKSPSTPSTSTIPIPSSSSPSTPKVKIVPKTKSKPECRLLKKGRKKRLFRGAFRDSFDFTDSGLYTALNISLNKTEKSKQMDRSELMEKFLPSLSDNEKRRFAKNLAGLNHVEFTDTNINHAVDKINEFIATVANFNMFNLTSSDIIDAIKSIPTSTYIKESIYNPEVPNSIQKVQQHLLPKATITPPNTESQLKMLIEVTLKKYASNISRIYHTTGYDKSAKFNTLSALLTYPENSDLPYEVKTLNSLSTSLTPEEKATRKELAQIIKTNLNSPSDIENIFAKLFVKTNSKSNPSIHNLYIESIKFILNDWLIKYDSLRDREPFETISITQPIPPSIDMKAHSSFMTRYKAYSLTEEDNSLAEILSKILPAITPLISYLEKSTSPSLISLKAHYETSNSLPPNLWLQVYNFKNTGTTLSLLLSTLPIYEQLQKILTKLNNLDDLSRNSIIEIFFKFPSYKQIPQTIKQIISIQSKKVSNLPLTPPSPEDTEKKLKILNTIKQDLTPSEKRIISNITRIFTSPTPLKNEESILLDVILTEHSSQISDPEITFGPHVYSKITFHEPLTPEQKLLQKISSSITRAKAIPISSQLKQLYQLPSSQVETLYSEMLSGEDTGANEGLLIIYHPTLVNPSILKLIRTLSQK